MTPPRIHERESAFQAWVVDLAHYCGWTVAHFGAAPTHNNRGSGYATPAKYEGAGWPDLTLARPGEVIFAELKSDRGVLSDKQKVWIDLLSSAGLEVYVWRPACRPEIEARLKRVYT